MINIIVLLVAVIAYFVGAIPIGYIVARLKGVQDIREHGSGNIGATNVSRFLGLHYFFLIFFLDAGKAFLFMHFITPYFPEEYLYAFATIFLLGNSCSVFLGGSGGKGVATLFGLVSALNLTAVGVLLVIWCCGMIITKTVGIASIFTVASLPLYAYWINDDMFFYFSCVVAAWVLWLHRSNMRNYWERYCSKK